NMVFLELQNKFKKIYYLDNIDFYIPKNNSIILSIPFFNDLILNTITKKVLNAILEYNISEITIVTISNTQVLFLEDLEVQILPFYEWALS
ncbi:MAG: ATP-binding protein, partial [Campylobacteraceae bacterium]|nr:ATP-binding protein [Campylobacteraceae bacterium]